MVKFTVPDDGFAVDFGMVDGKPVVYVARFSKGKRRACAKISPSSAQALARELTSAADRAAALPTKQEK